MTRLLSTERKFQTMSRRVGILDALEKHFDSSSRAKQEAIAHAERNWNLKKAAQAGDIETVKHLTRGSDSDIETTQHLTHKPAPSWADLKFGSRQKR